jgi:hypothetical protein
MFFYLFLFWFCIVRGFWVVYVDLYSWMLVFVLGESFVLFCVFLFFLVIFWVLGVSFYVV